MCQIQVVCFYGLRLNCQNFNSILAYRMQCHSCMSPYLEDQFVYISHLYRKPLSFTGYFNRLLYITIDLEKCDRQSFDWRHVKLKNCTDLCVTLRMNDKVGGILIVKIANLAKLRSTSEWLHARLHV